MTAETIKAEAGIDADAEVKRLAALSSLQYERERDDAAKVLGVRVSALDKEVRDVRGANDDANDDEVVEELDPWFEPVDGAVLDEMRADFERYVIADDESLNALAVWTLGSYCYDAFSIFPKAFLSSPERRCGKTVTLEVIEANAHRALTASSISSSAVFRAVQEWRPTLLIDEADRLPKDNEELVGIINAGHRKRTAVVIRNVKVSDDHVPRKFSVWAPMVLAAIGRMADTIMDRSVVVHLRRKAPGETVEKLPVDLFERNRERRRRCLRWAQDAEGKLRATKVQMPRHSNDRMLDNWLPLFTVAEVVGGDWPARIQAAFARLSIEEEEESIGPMLLGDIREVFDTHGRDVAFSHDLVGDLIALEGRPWAEWKRGKAMTQNSLARLLEPYKIRPQSVRIGSTHKKGYRLTHFRDAWHRYLTDPSPSDPPFQTGTTGHPSNGAGSSQIQSGTKTENVPVRNGREPSNGAGCPGVPVQKGGTDEGNTSDLPRYEI
jgi:hypothetical protein